MEVREGAARFAALLLFCNSRILEVSSERRSSGAYESTSPQLCLPRTQAITLV